MAVPSRIVSLVPSHTETLHALGLADRVVGRTRFCVHPAPWVETVASVGGTKDAKLGRILELVPDLVVADKDENPKALVDGLVDAGVAVVWSEIDTVEDAAAFIERLAGVCGADGPGQAAAAEVRAAVDDVRDGQRPMPVFCPIWYGPWMTFDRTAYPHDVLAAVGFQNVFADHEGPKYFEVEPADVAASGAFATLLPTEPFPFHKQRDRVDLSGLGGAAGTGRVHIIDGEALTWFGVRTGPGLRALAEARREMGDTAAPDGGEEAEEGGAGA